MKQSLVYLLILIFSLPSFAGGEAMHSDMPQSNMTQMLTCTQDSQQELQQPCHHSDVMSDQVTAETSNHHRCCEQQENAPLPTHSDCEDNCSECSHSCSGFCLALLPSNHKAVVAQSQLHILAAVRLPAAPYQNPLIPPIIRA